MNVDVPTGLWIAASAATAVVTVIVGAAVLSSPERRAARRVLAGLLAWLAADIALGAAGVFAAGPSTWFPFIALGIAVPIVAGIALLARPGTVRRLMQSIPLRRVIGVQVYRAAGVIFLIAWASGRMPGVFALPAGIGDIAVGLAAPFVAARVGAGVDGSVRTRRTATVWNLLGIADLVVAVSLGFLSSPSHFELLASSSPNALITRMPYVLIPAFAVPLSILLHLAALARLRSAERPPARAAIHRASTAPWLNA